LLPERKKFPSTVERWPWRKVSEPSLLWNVLARNVLSDALLVTASRNRHRNGCTGHRLQRRSVATISPIHRFSPPRATTTSTLRQLLNMELLVWFGVLVGLELWRRSLLDRAPRWVHSVIVGLFLAAVVGVAHTLWSVPRAFESLGTMHPANKATELSNAISTAMHGAVVGMGCTLLAIIVLAIATWRAPREPRQGPVAQVTFRTGNDLPADPNEGS
jgi:hypothetical protein